MTTEQTPFDLSEKEQADYEAYIYSIRVEVASALPSIAPMLRMLDDRVVENIHINLCQTIDELEIDKAFTRLGEIAEKRGVCPDCGAPIKGPSDDHVSTH
jgi:hypothetical protein